MKPYERLHFRAGHPHQKDAHVYPAMKRLLVLSCSQSKVAERARLPAIRRYNGPAFRLLRRYMENTSEELDIQILSAEFGLIPATRLIPSYDRCMTKLRAHELKTKVANQVRRLYDAESVRQKRLLFINLGRNYNRAFESALAFLSPTSIITEASGTTGKRLAEMYDWLYGADSALRRPIDPQPATGIITLRGVGIAMTKDQVLASARKALKRGDRTAFSYQSWYVQVDGVRVSPKWLVSLLTDLPVGAFHSDEARRVLLRLGMKVIRV